MLPRLTRMLEQIEWRQFGRLVVHRRIFRQITDGWNRHLQEQRALELWTFMYDGYIAFATMALRRMVDAHKDSVSVVNLFREIQQPETLQLVSRERFLLAHVDMRHAPGMQNLVAYSAVYDTITDGDPDLTAAKVDEHLTLLKSVTDPVRKLANKAIAHSDTKADPQTTLGELNTAIDTIAMLLDKYSWLLRGRGIAHHVANVEKSFDMTEYISKIWP